MLTVAPARLPPPASVTLRLPSTTVLEFSTYGRTVAAVVTTGASLTAVTVRLAVSLVLENAVAAPVEVASASSPLAPLLRSQARKVMASARLPFQSADGWKYRRVPASADSRRADASLTLPMASQLPPLLVEYHQLPPLVLVAVTALPVRAPLSASLTLSTCPAGVAKSTRLDTRLPTAPDGAPASSTVVASAGLFEASSVGAVLAARL